MALNRASGFRVPSNSYHLLPRLTNMLHLRVLVPHVLSSKCSAFVVTSNSCMFDNSSTSKALQDMRFQYQQSQQQVREPC